MTMESGNEANDANFAEVQYHLDRIQAQLKTAQGERRNELLADQEAYWEQAVNYRRMASETYLLERNEARQQVLTLQKLYDHAYWQRALLAFVWVTTAVAVVHESMWPGALKEMVEKIFHFLSTLRNHK